jgi:hypothetical protein
MSLPPTPTSASQVIRNVASNVSNSSFEPPVAIDLLEFDAPNITNTTNWTPVIITGSVVGTLLLIVVVVGVSLLVYDRYTRSHPGQTISVNPPTAVSQIGNSLGEESEPNISEEGYLLQRRQEEDERNKKLEFRTT